jgi:hypothetical protein
MGMDSEWEMPDLWLKGQIGIFPAGAINFAPGEWGRRTCGMRNLSLEGTQNLSCGRSLFHA